MPCHRASARNPDNTLVTRSEEGQGLSGVAPPAADGDGLPGGGLLASSSRLGGMVTWVSSTVRGMWKGRRLLDEDLVT